jgi:hypothetical protein
VLHGVLWQQPLIASILLWWLKPVFDRFVLHVVSRCVFGATPNLADTLRDWRRILSPGLLASLTWRRIDPARSFNLPVVQLEGQTGRGARARRKLLGRRMRGFGFWLTLACINFVLLLQMAGSFALVQFLPVGDQPDDGAARGGLFAIDSWWTATDSALYVIGESLIEPFFVAAGFALYLSRRVMLEGWDIELSLRRMAARLELRAQARRAAAALLLGVVAAGMSPGATAAACEPVSGTPAQAAPAQDAADDDDTNAEDADAEDADADDAVKEADRAAPATGACLDPNAASRAPLATPARAAIVAVLENPIYGHYKDVEHWRYRFQTERKDEPARFSWLRKIGKLLAQLMQGLSWVVLGALVLALIVAIARRWNEQRGAEGGSAPPSVLFGLKIAPESLPDDIAGSALGLLDAGQVREALSLIYRGTLSILVHERGLRVLPGDTEGEVTLKAGPLLAPEAADYFGRLVAQWVAVAYARRPADIDAVRALCRAFDRHFARAPAPATAPEPARA